VENNWEEGFWGGLLDLWACGWFIWVHCDLETGVGLGEEEKKLF
jgi:hypothetical protein